MIANDYTVLPPKIIEGKTKIIYENPDDENGKTVSMVFKDDITAGDGAKHDSIEGKAVIDWQVNKDIFEFLNRKGVRTHYLSSSKEKWSLVKKLDKKIDIEVVTRRVAAGSIVKWGNIAEGTWFNHLKTQFHYKDDSLHDPMLDEEYVNYIIREKSASEYEKMSRMNKEIFVRLEQAFSQFNIQLIDIKLEYGIINKQVILIDEITGGSFRLWPYANENPDLSKNNVLSELNPEGRLDKDIYRMGESLGKVKSRFKAIAEITAKFRDLL